ncbi:TetR/AcrR family transcriptional regulator [Gordonia terrae]|uniref:TetR/AcrR family transcriptional regulator n=1 Tax=Gordonia terrae TaxID=2055 RepID=UPI003F6B5564
MTNVHENAAVESNAADAATPAQRLLATATELFAAQGIRSVGIDLILRTSGVAKASLYSAYGSKDGLVIAYLDHLDHADRNRWVDGTATLGGPRERILAFFDLAIAGAPARNYRGCQYANAATEFPGAQLPPVTAHREWVLTTLTDNLRQLDAADPESVAREIQVVYDGALAGSKMERSTAPIAVGRRLTELLLDVSAGATTADHRRDVARGDVEPHLPGR